MGVTLARVDIALIGANLSTMAFVAYLLSIVAAFVGVLALYGTLLKPMTAKRPPPAQAVAADKAEPETTSSTRTHATSTQAKQDEALTARRKHDEARDAHKRDDASEARAQEEADAAPAPARVPATTSRRSPVRSEPGEGLRLAPERCWIVTDSTRGFGYYDRCQ